MRVLILTSSTGGGHDMRAQAFQAWAQRAPELRIDVQVHHPLESSHWLYRFGVGLYNWIQRTAPVLHHLYFNFLEAVPVVQTGAPLGTQYYRAALKDICPDVILSVHDSLNHDFFGYARKVLGAGNVRCVTYCGELHDGYGFSRHWINPSADLFIGAVPETCDAAIRRGMPSKKTGVGGFLLRPSFYEPLPDAVARRAYIREQLGFDPDEFVLVLTASSHGANNHLAFLKALLQARADAQVVVLCGKSEHMRRCVEAWARENPSLPMRVLAHNVDMGQLMRCASAIVARPGTGTTSEAILSGCPLILNCVGGTMPQEMLTVRFCRKHGLAEVVQRPDGLAALVRRWAEQPGQCQLIRERMLRARPVSHPSAIVAAIAGLGVKAGSSAAGPIPVIEAARAARPAEQPAPEKIRQPSLRSADADHR